MQQFGDAGAGFGGAEADRHEVILAQRLLERIVQLLGRELLALLEVERHQLFVDLDDLVDDLGVRGLDRGEVRRLARAAGRSSRRPRCRRRPAGSAAGTPCRTARGFPSSTSSVRASRLSILLMTISRHSPRVFAKSIMRWVIGSTPLTALTTIDRGLDRFERAQRAAEKIGISRRIDDVDALALRLEPADRGIERMQQGFFLRVEIADGRAASERPLGPYGTGLREQGFGQQRLARAGLAHERDVADVRRCIGHVMPPVMVLTATMDEAYARPNMAARAVYRDWLRAAFKVESAYTRRRQAPHKETRERMTTGKRALIVDDSRSARVILSRMLEQNGMTVDTAESAEQALDYLPASRPDVIFMDHLMPGMDGFQAVQAIKSDPLTATIPLMMYTSQEGELYVSQARALGAVGVLPKTVRPVDVSRILYQLHLLPDRRTRRTALFEGPAAAAAAAAESRP